MAATQFSTTDNVTVTPHARTNWRDRSAMPDKRIDVAWREATGLHWPGTFSGTYARYHPGAAVIMIAKADGTMVSVWPPKYVDDPGLHREVRDAMREWDGEIGVAPSGSDGSDSAEQPEARYE